MDHPHHDEGLELSRRIYYSITQSGDLESHRIAKFTALLAEHLVDKGLMDEAEIMAIMDEVMGS